MTKDNNDASARDAGTLTVESEDSAIQDHGDEPSKGLGDLYGIDDEEIGAADESPEKIEDDEDAEDAENADATPEDTEDTEDDEESEAEDEETAEEEDEDTEDEASEEAEDAEEFKGASPKLIRELKKTRKRAQEAEAQRGELTTQNQALKDQVSHLQAAKVIPAPTAQDPLADIQDAATLIQVREAHQATLDWIEDNAEAIRELGEEDTLEVPFFQRDGKPVAVNKQQLDRIKQQARVELRAVPQREAFLHEQSRYVSTLHAGFPELKTPGSELRKDVDQVLASVPEVKRFAKSEGIALCQVLGQKLLAKLGAKALEHVTNLEAPTAKKAAKVKNQRVPGVGSQQPTPGRKTRRQRAQMRKQKSDTKQISKPTMADRYGVTADELR